jgi:hypothetical protein
MSNIFSHSVGCPFSSQNFNAEVEMGPEIYLNTYGKRNGFSQGYLAIGALGNPEIASYLQTNLCIWC